MTKIFSLLILSILLLSAVSALTITSTTSNPTEVQPGEKVELTLNIENDLNEDIENVIVSLTLSSSTSILPFAPYQSSNEYKIDEINEGDKEKAKFELLAYSDAESGTYTIPVQVTYTLENGTIVSAKSIGVITAIINAKPIIEISLEDSTLIKGTNGQLNFKIINSGMGESKFLSVKITPVNGIKILGTNKIYIGSIDSNDFDNAEFQIFSNPNSISPINLPVEITYTDSMNNQITENNIIPIPVYSQEDAIKMGLIKKDNTFMIVIGILLVVGVYFFYRKSKKKNKKSNAE